MRRRSLAIAFAVALMIASAPAMRSPAHAESSLPELSAPPPSARFT